MNYTRNNGAADELLNTGGTAASDNKLPNHSLKHDMKTSIIRTLAITTAILGLSAGSTRLLAAQPEMNEAIEQLEKAKHSEHPIEHLERAKHHLEEARHNKHGERVEAIHQINEAIADAKKHEHRRMEEHIDRAIHEVREGKEESRRRR